MDNRGVFLDFLVCKVGVAIVAISLIGAVLVMSSSSKRNVERAEMTAVADTIGQTIRAIDGMPWEVQITRELPSIGSQFLIEIVGTYDNVQLVRVIMDGGQSHVERLFLLREKINGGFFELSSGSPTLIRLSKVDGICLELI
jgi:hypothetical protein